MPGSAHYPKMLRDVAVLEILPRLLLRVNPLRMQIQLRQRARSIVEEGKASPHERLIQVPGEGKPNDIQLSPFHQY